MLVGVIGPCGAGKSSLVAGLQTQGYKSRHIAQEHSYVQDMWKRITDPDVLIFLEVSYENTIIRRKLDWTVAEYTEQLRRLRHARSNADLVIETDQLTKEQVLQKAIGFLVSISQK